MEKDLNEEEEEGGGSGGGENGLSHTKIWKNLDQPDIDQQSALLWYWKILNRMSTNGDYFPFD